MSRNAFWLATLLVGGALIALAFVFASGPAAAQDDGTPPTTQSEDSYCLLCHAQPDQAITLPDGSTLDISVDPAALADSVHGTENPMGPLACTACHGDMRFPHQEPLPADRRAVTLEMTRSCATCHTEQASELADGVHARAVAAGNPRAATCVDCHGAHDIQPPAEQPRTATAETCGTCHTIAFGEYRQSVHGEALFAGDPNVPDCTDCHGVHGIDHPTTALFRNRSPELCAECHADENLMEQYDITTNVFNSYLTDFHGTTVQLFEQQDPNVATNKAVCFDCHGVHNIAEVSAANSRVVKENLLETCQNCHPDATSNFPDAWVGHYPPTFESHPLLFAVDTFYTILIPLVLGGFAVLIALDVFRRIRQRGRREIHG